MNYLAQKKQARNRPFEEMGRRETWPWGDKRQRTCFRARKSASFPPSLGIETSNSVSTSPSIVGPSDHEEKSDSHDQMALNISNRDNVGFQVTSMGKFTEAGIGEVPSKGVRRRGTKWVAEIRNRHLKGSRHPGRKWLGTFLTAAEAREAYGEAVKKIKSHERQKASRNLKSLDASHSSLGNSRRDRCSILSSSSASIGPGGKRVLGKIQDEREMSKKARMGIHDQVHLDNHMIGSGSCTTEDLASGRLDSIDFLEMKDRSSSEQEDSMIQSSTKCSSDSPRKNLPLSQSATKFRTDVRFRRPKELELTHAPCLTCFSDSFYPSYDDEASNSAATASPTASKSPISSSEKSRWIDKAIKNQNHGSSREASSRRKKAVTTASHAHGPCKRAPEKSPASRKLRDNVHGQVTRENDIQGISTNNSRSYRNAVVDHADTVNYSQPACGGNDCFSADEVHASSPTCTCTWMCTAEDHKCFPSCSCFCSCQPVQKNLKENLDWLEELEENGAAFDPVQNSVQTEIISVQSWDTSVKLEDLAAFKTRHILSELKSKSVSKCPDLPRTKVLSISSGQRQLNEEKDYKKECTGSPFSSPASSAVCNNITSVSENQVSLIESVLVMNRAEQFVKTNLVESGSLTLDACYLSDDDGASESTLLKESTSDGLNFLPVDEFLEYF